MLPTGHAAACSAVCCLVYACKMRLRVCTAPGTACAGGSCCSCCHVASTCLYSQQQLQRAENGHHIGCVLSALAALCSSCLLSRHLGCFGLLLGGHLACCQLVGHITMYALYVLQQVRAGRQVALVLRARQHLRPTVCQCGTASNLPSLHSPRLYQVPWVGCMHMFPWACRSSAAVVRDKTASC